MMAGNTPGVRWELDRLVAQQASSRAILLPPTRKDSAAGTAVLQQAIAQLLDTPETVALSSSTIAIVKLKDGVLAIEADSRNFENMYLGLLLAAYEIVKEIGSDHV